jgi:hypothetical protein
MGRARPARRRRHISPVRFACFTGAVRVEPVFQVGDPVRRTHIAVQESLNGKNVDWMEKVSDEQYRR